MITLSRWGTVLVAVLAMTLLFGSPVRAEFSFVHASDTHAGAPERAEVDARLFKEMAGLNPKPAFVIVTGDIVDYGTDEEYQRFHTAAAELNGIPLYLAPGNHDVRWNPLGKEGYTRGTGGKLYQSWDYKAVHFVLLDSTVLLEHWGHISQEQLDWLKADLHKVGPDRPVIIGFHHWIGRPEGDIYVDNQQALMDLVAPYNVVLWLQGHGHANVEWNVNGVPATMVGALYDGSYDLITITDDGQLKIRKRTWKHPKQATELLKKAGEDSKAPPPEVQWRDLLSVPLKKQPVPQWRTSAALAGGALKVTAERGELPAGAEMKVRVDTQDWQAAQAADDGWTITIPASELTSGVHVVTARATVPGGRAYRREIRVDVPGKVQPAWTTDIGGAVQSKLVRSGDLLYVTSMGGDLIALTAADGKERFRVKTGGPVFSSPEVSGGMVYFGSSDHFVYAADAGSGEVKWKIETAGAVLGGPAVAKGVVCIGSCDKKIYGLDANDGKVLWTVQGENMFQSKAATDGERFFIGGWDNHFRCIDARSGKIVWDLALGRPQKLPGFSAYAPSITHPVVGAGKVFVSTNDGIFHAIDIDSGTEAWKVDRKNMGYSSPCFQDGKVYFALSDKGDTYCADAESGKILWQQNVGSVIYDGGFAYGGGNVFVGCVNGTFNALDARTGKIVYQYRLPPGHLLATPAADAKRVYICSMNGIVTALPTRPLADTAEVGP